MRSLLIALVVIANTVVAQSTVKLSGKILHPLSDSVVVSYNDNNIAYYPKEFYAHVDKKGSFSFSFPVPEGRYIQAELKHGAHLAEMILYPGDSLVMSVDAAHFDSTVHYTGKGGATENFVARHTLEKGRMNQYTLKIKTDINKGPDDFLKSIEQEENTELAFLDKNKKGLPASFIKYWMAYYQYYNYFFMEQYPQIHELVRLKRYTDTIPEINFSVSKKIPLAFNDSLLQLPPYLLYLTGIFDIKLKEAGYTNLAKDTAIARIEQDSVSMLAYTLLPAKSAEYFAAQDLYGRIKTQQLERTRAQYSKFKQHWPASEYLPVIDKQMAVAERLAPGQPAPDLELTTLDGKNIKLSDLKGKVVYLHFWAAWCRQCVGEMMSEKKIKELIKNKPLEYVYVSIDEDTTMPPGIIKKAKLTGTFANVTGGWNAKELQQYGVQSLPAYFLIDEDGNIAMQNPPSPARSTELILAIEKLFK